MRKAIVDEVSNVIKIKRKDMIEKDIILHEILTDLSKDIFFSKSFVFKGGTCLVKSYLGYFRFSEDIDFTWKNQKVFRGKSQKHIRSYLSSVIDKTGNVFEKIAKKRDLDFKCAKNNRDYVELGGSNKFCTFKIWYNSEILGRKSFVKVQINFVEEILFSLKNKMLKSLASDNKKLAGLFPENKEYFKAVAFEVYDIREILCEKVRAILTRKGIKARDFVDVYLICKQNGIKLSNMEKYIIKKTNFTLGLYNKYRENLKTKTTLLESEKFFDWGQEKDLLLQKLEDKDFYAFLKKLNEFLRKIIQQLYKS